MAVSRRHSFLQVYLTMAVLYLGHVAGISVKFGTNDGPIVPPTPSPPTPPPRPPFRDPAPVWEDQTGDIPNPNPYKAPVPPHLIHYFNKISTTPPTTTIRPAGSPTRYTHVIYQPKTISSTTLSPVKSFVQAYAQPTTTQPPKPQVPQQQPRQGENNVNDYNYQNIDAQSTNYQGYNTQFGIRYIPGYGFKYITPDQDRDPRKYNKPYKYYQDKHNSLETNNIFGGEMHQHDMDLAYDKYLAQRVKKSVQHQTFVAHQQPLAYYHQQPLFFPARYV